ncbi:mCG1030595, partial [Mus musculus]
PFHPFPHVLPSFFSLLPHPPAAVTACLQKSQGPVLSFLNRTLYKLHTLPESHQGFCAFRIYHSQGTPEEQKGNPMHVWAES